MRIVVLGDGAMGTACSLLLASKLEHQVWLWSAFEEQAEELRRWRENRRFLPGVQIPQRVQIICGEANVLADADLYVVAIPTIYLRSTLSRIARLIAPGRPVVSVVKGIEIGTFARPSEIIRQVLGERPVVVLSGPSHAEEIARNLPASVVSACPERSYAVLVQELFSTPRFRVYTNPDIVGVELAGALKNIVGIAAGVCDGLELGDNAKSALLTRGLVEIMRFGISFGARRETFWGLAGIGDLITTCISPYGRNRHVGELIGRGKTLQEILAEMKSVAEGVWTCKAVYAICRQRGIEMPITSEVYHVLYEGRSPTEALENLMSRDPKAEFEFQSWSET